jgi:hypothetical protein
MNFVGVVSQQTSVLSSFQLLLNDCDVLTFYRNVIRRRYYVVLHLALASAIGVMMVC